MIVYHGTTMEIQKPDIRHSKAHLDFGRGFYATTFPKQAEIIDGIMILKEYYEVKP